MYKNNQIAFVALLIIVFGVVFLYYIGANHNREVNNRQLELERGIFLLNQGEYLESEKIIEKFKDVYFSNSYYFNMNYARVLAKNGKFKEAQEYYIKVYNIQPSFLNNKSFILEMKRIEELAANER